MTRPNGALVAVLFAMIAVAAATAEAQRQMEKLDRGLVAIHQGGGTVYVGWRLLGTDPGHIAFNLYRSEGQGEPLKLNDRSLTRSTNYVDTGVDFSRPQSYFVRPVLEGKELKASAAFTLPADAPARPYLAIPLRTPEGCTPNDASVGDLDGDGEYEIVLHQAPRGRDNSQSGTTGEPVFEAYRLDGTFLWMILLGKNTRGGAAYTQFIVYDLDGDGRAEFACKTADGTIDGAGKVLGDGDADYRNARGYVLDGPEFLTIFDGRTGAELVTVDYIPPRGNVLDWGDDYGNRVDRFLACVAYLDGRRPSLVMCRGYYTRAVLAAWNWRRGLSQFSRSENGSVPLHTPQLTPAPVLAHLWTFDSDDGTAGNRAYRGQGNHNLSVGDVDGDGNDEIVYGACAIDHDGTGLYSTGLGHGDAMHLSDIDSARPGLEVFAIHERPRHPYGANLRDAATGKVLWGLPLEDPGRGLAMDIDPRHPGYECWANNSDGIYNCRGEKISDAKPRSCNMGIWWDGDLLREIVDGSSPRRWSGGRGGAFIDKWDYDRGATTRLLDGAQYDCVTNNGTKANPCLCADILGDWREEVIWRTADGRELRIFTTTIPTDRRQYTLMHDPVYRLGVAWQNVAYNQPTQPGFYMGQGMARPPRPNIVMAGDAGIKPSPLRIGGPPARGFRRAGNLVHDPSTIVKCKDVYWLFATGRGIVSRRSEDLVHWRNGPPVFASPPAWTAEAVPGNRGRYWAPDVIRLGDRYLLYYSVSTWGKNTSAIGLAVNATLDPSDPNFQWTDHGIVIQTGSSDDFNAIDPAVTRSPDGRLWLAFGSFWTGIKLIELDPASGKRISPDSPIHQLASHESIEAPMICHRHGYYYLLVNWGLCARGVESTYNIRVGRSARITGPYLDKQGVNMLHDGGSLLLGTEGKFIGPGHAGIVSEGGRDWLSYHYYDGDRRGVPTLGMRRLQWDADGWPKLQAPIDAAE